jgi:hypothetical protein
MDFYKTLSSQSLKDVVYLPIRHLGIPADSVRFGNYIF